MERASEPEYYWHGRIQLVSTSIEGSYRSPQEDAIAAVLDEEPLDAETETWRALTGYREALTYIINLATDPYFEYHSQLIRSLHFMMLKYDITQHPGQWRPGSISVIQEGNPDRSFIRRPDDVEKSPISRESLLTCFKRGGRFHNPARILAAMAHLNLTMIHPFSDGNGRMARALQTLVLARDGAPNPIFSSIEEWLGRNRQSYYDVLAAVGQGEWHPENDPSPWIRFCVRAHFQQMTTIIRRNEEMSQVFQEISTFVAREKLPARCELPLVDAAYGLRITRPMYILSADVTEFVASRDLKRLADLGLTVPSWREAGTLLYGQPGTSRNQATHQGCISDA